jgi:hypothetical protein
VYVFLVMYALECDSDTVFSQRQQLEAKVESLVQLLANSVNGHSALSTAHKSNETKDTKEAGNKFI